MNYFEFYDIPESFIIDDAALKKQFYQLSKQYHPDFYATESDEKQQEILELSTLNNKAYHTLADPAKRMEYILKEHDLLKEGAKPQLPADFLMEMMELNERLMEAENAQELGKIATEVMEFEDELNQAIQKLTIDYQILNSTAKQERLNEVVNIYYKQKYMLRIKESLDTFAARF